VINLAVHMGGQLVGTLDAVDRRSLRSTYDPGYASGPASTPLSVSMPLRVSPYLHAIVHPYLWGLLPDDDRVLERWAREFACSSTDVARLLRGVGGDVAGAAQYVVPDGAPEESQPGDVAWLSDDDIARFLGTCGATQRRGARIRQAGGASRAPRRTSPSSTTGRLTDGEFLPARRRPLTS
jgi:serine/threonine-protein kinase HipA